MRFPPKNFPDDLRQWTTEGFAPPEACEANWRRMYGFREAMMPAVILVWFPVIYAISLFQPSIPVILAFTVAAILTGWSATFRQWHLRRDAEAYLRWDYELWRAQPGREPVECEFLTLGCRVFRHRHPSHEAAGSTR